MRSTSFFSARRSSAARGRARKRLIRRSRIKNASRKARSISAASPRTAAGSGTPQCAVMGCPGQSGQISLAALSQTVKTKCIAGAPGRANSSQLLLRRPAVDMRGHRKLLQSFGANRPRRMTSGAVGGEGGLSFVVEDCLRHDRTRRVSRAQKQNVVVSIHRESSVVPVRFVSGRRLQRCL